MMKLLLILPFTMIIGNAQTCTQTFTPSTIGTSPYPGSNVNAAVQKATAGTVLCFATGTYGEIDVYAAHPPSKVILQPASGAAAVLGYVTFNGVSNVTMTAFNGPSIIRGGFSIINAGQGNSNNIEFINNNLGSSGILVRDNTSANANILIANNTITNFRVNGGYEPALMVVNTGAASCPNGIVFQNNHVNGSVGDGMGTGGGACGTRFIGNDIEGFVESACGAVHCDGFQDNGGGRQTVLDGNYFHNNTNCFGLYDGSSGLVIKNNVCSTASDSGYWMQFGGAQTITFDHNTVVSKSGATYGTDHGGTSSSNVTFTNNIFPEQPVLNPGQNLSGTFVSDYNLCRSGCSGAHSFVGTPSYSGGTTPSTYSGYKLAPGSIGTSAATDSTDIGIKVAVSGSQPQPPTLLTVTVR